jgi:hypothetical protein
MTEPSITCRNGHENEPGSKFCEQCGVALVATAARLEPPPAGESAPPGPVGSPRTQGQPASMGGGIPARTVVLLAAVIAIGAAAATGGLVYFLSGDDAESVSPEPTATIPATIPAQPTPTAVPTDTPTPTPTPLPGETAGNPLPLGVAKRGFDGWEVFVARADFDAVQEVLARNPLNEPPADGNTFVIVRLSATNREAQPDAGSDTTEFSPGSTFQLVGDGENYYSFDNEGCGVIPDGFVFLDNPQPRGGTVEGNICFHVPITFSTAAVLFDDASNTYFALR